MVRSLKLSSSGEAALAADLIMSSEFQSSGDCAGSRLDHELEISLEEAALAADLIRNFQSSGGCTGSRLEILMVRGGCANSQLDQGLEVLITLALR